MYFRILKKDLKRKRTMNIILLVFITLASMFIASSANNMFSIVTALDNYFEKANVFDCWFATTEEAAVTRFEAFAQENGYDFKREELAQINSKDVYIDGIQFDYGNSLLLSETSDSVKVFDSEENEIIKVNDGEIYVPSNILHDSSYNFKIGSEIKITVNGITKTFILKDYTKDVLYGSSMFGATRFLISKNDFSEFINENAAIMYSEYVYTSDESFFQKFYNLELPTIFNMDTSKLRLMYLMELVIAAVILIVSICLILISLVILRFTINFTISEDFREIGVMKAIGLDYGSIRRIYTAKYLAISIVGASIGFVLSIPFGKMLLRDVSRNIIISADNMIIMNLIFSILTAGIVIFFCQRCTKKIEKLSPIDAIRNGQSGERFSHKSVINLGNSKLPTVPFLAINDIFSGIRRFIIMIIIFTLGLLLIIIPENTISTLQSGKLITWFNMAECDHVISYENTTLGNNVHQEMLDTQLRVREFLKENNIPAEVFQEELWNVSISFNDNNTSSLAFQGTGDITDDRYVYTEGTPPQNDHEVAITSIIAERLGATIGDEVEITNVDTSKKYTITALYQSMNNMGEGVRFYHDENLDHSNLSAFSIQIRYTDNPNNKTLNERKELLKNHFKNFKVYTSGEYISVMMGDVAGQVRNVRLMTVLVILAINTLVTILMEKSFITKEKGEIAILKAIGFKNKTIVAWQTLRIGITVFIASIIAVVLSTPLSQITVEPIFKLLGAQSIEFQLRPLVTFVLYPLLVLIITALAALLTSLQTNKIKASDTAASE